MSEPEYIPPDPPAFLHRTGREAWAALCDEHELSDVAELALLERACSALDREAQARRKLRDDGLYLEDRFGRLYPHAAVAVEAKARAQAAQIIGQLLRARLAEDRLELQLEREIRMSRKDEALRAKRPPRRGVSAPHE